MEIDLNKAYSMFNMKRKNDISGGVANLMDRVIKANVKPAAMRPQEIQLIHSNFCEVYSDQLKRARDLGYAEGLKAAKATVSTKAAPATTESTEASVALSVPASSTMSCVDIVGAGKKKSVIGSTASKTTSSSRKKKTGRSGLNVFSAAESTQTS